MSVWEWVTNAIETFALTTVESPWVLLVVLALCIIDAIFPPVPSESVIIAIATVVVADHPNTLWLLGAIAAVGAFTGDQMVYWIGRRLGARNPKWLSGRRAQRTLNWAKRAIMRSGPILIMTGRFIPVGRTAVNLAAGTTRYPAWKFTIAAAFAAVFWAAYSIAIGAIFGNIFGSHPLLALMLGLVTAFAIGLLVEFISKRIGRRVHARRMVALRAAATSSIQAKAVSDEAA
ncbi:DedA family protein [Leucobacter komagatae]|uniref:DedA family protein n=1 Tax=Leucobacter komagatae TaxID=55969 RepID=UPI000697368C|nr:DedA family protein [Leucobacter komagatae]